MIESSFSIDECYRFFKQFKERRVLLPEDLDQEKIGPNDIYFAVHKNNPTEGIKGFLLKCYLTLDANMPLIDKPVRSFFNKSGNYKFFYSLYGDNYANWCLKRGAAYSVIDNPRMKKGPRYILVDDVDHTLERLAVIRRKELNAEFIAVTGSCGKTTTTALTTFILRKKYAAESTKGNKNALWAIPQAILNFDENADLGVVEMGIRAFNEISKYCHIVKPDCGIITCIGKAHLAGFQTKDGVLKAKRELFDFLISRNGQLFKNLNDPLLATLASDYKQTTTYGRTEDADVFGKIIDSSQLLKIRWYPTKRSRSEYYDVSTKLYGEYNLNNILAAIAVALHYDISPKLICEALQEYETVGLRSQIIKYGTNTIYVDCYNANPTSMQAALVNFAKIRAAKRVAILGDMLELGHSTGREHTEMVAYTRNLNIDQTVFVGEAFKKAMDNDWGTYFSTVKAARKWFNQQAFENTHILLKASRGIAIERMVKL